MNCPRCGKTKLEALELAGQVETDACPDCNGMFFEEGEMGTFLRFSKDLPGYKELLAKATTGVTCPQCAAKMKEIQYIPEKDLMVDFCEVCQGVWLDGGELTEAKDIADGQDTRKLRLMRAIWDMRAQARGEVTLRCPKCDKQSVNAMTTSEGVEIDFCSLCGGTWFEAGELADTCEVAEDIPDLAAAMATAKPTEYKCPNCKGEHLVEIEYSQIKLESGILKVDYCKSCKGIWVDKNEMVQLECIAAQTGTPGSRLGKTFSGLMKEGYIPM